MIWPPAAQDALATSLEEFERLGLVRPASVLVTEYLEALTAERVIDAETASRIVAAYHRLRYGEPRSKRERGRGRDCEPEGRGCGVWEPASGQTAKFGPADCQPAPIAARRRGGAARSRAGHRSRVVAGRPWDCRTQRSGRSRNSRPIHRTPTLPSNPVLRPIRRSAKVAQPPHPFAPS